MICNLNELVDIMPMIKNQVVIGRFDIQHPDCEDLENDIFIRCLKYLRRYDSNKSALSSWAYRVAIWTSLDFLKQRKFIADYEPLEQESRDCSVYQEFLLSEISVAIYDDNRMLTKKQKFVAKRLLQGYSTRETAQTMGVTDAVVFQMKKKIFKKVKERIMGNNEKRKELGLYD